MMKRCYVTGKKERERESNIKNERDGKNDHDRDDENHLLHFLLLFINIIIIIIHITLEDNSFFSFHLFFLFIWLIFSHLCIIMSPSSVYILTAIGKRQSPIDIVTDSVQVTRRLLTRSIVEDNGDVVDHGKTDLQIDYTPITNSGGNLSLENTGHGWKLNIPNSIGEQCRKCVLDIKVYLNFKLSS